METPNKTQAVVPVLRFANALSAAVRRGDNVAVARSISRITLKQLEQRRKELNGLFIRLGELRRFYKLATTDKERSDIEKAGLQVRSEIPRYLDQVTLGDMRRGGQEEDAEMEVALLITWVQEQLNVQAPLLEDQILTGAAMIVSDSGSLRIGDLAICFRRGVKGVYQRQYGKFDVQDLLSWIELYKEELNERRIRENENDHLANKASKWDKRYSKSLRATIYNHQHQNNSK